MDYLWTFIAFGVYLLVMLLIGFLSMKRTKSSEDYFLGGRSLNGWVAALSAQASDMSGWLLMGLPGAIYALGTGQIWIAVGLCIGTILNWALISSRLRRYTIAREILSPCRHFSRTGSMTSQSSSEWLLPYLSWFSSWFIPPLPFLPERNYFLLFLAWTTYGFGHWRRGYFDLHLFRRLFGGMLD